MSKTIESESDENVEKQNALNLKTLQEQKKTLKVNFLK